MIYCNHIAGSTKPELNNIEGRNIINRYPRGAGGEPVTYKYVQFLNYDACTILVNETDKLYLPAYAGAVLNMRVESLRILDIHVRYIWTGGY